MKPDPRAFILIALIGGLAIFSSTLSKTPVLPLFALSLHASPAEIGWIVMASTLPGVLISYPAGALSPTSPATAATARRWACCAR